VSVLVVVRNEADCIDECLRSILAQYLPAERYEVIVVDGMSGDGTREAVEAVIRDHPERRIRLLDNPKRILASGWNIGLRAAEGPYVIRVDTHAALPADFLRTNLRVMAKQPDAAAVGGVLRTRGRGLLGEVIAAALSSRFGVGGSTFRVGGRAGEADTAVFALYRRQVLLEAGGFDESLKRNQDLLCHARIRAAGGRFYFDPAIRSTYYCRRRLGALARQMYGNGHWLALLLWHRRRGAFSTRHLVPLVFLAALLTLGLLAVWFAAARWALLGLAAVYLAAALWAAARTTLSLGRRLVFPLVTLVMHLSYGAGWLTGLLRLAFYRPGARRDD
jgi:glycosyltransferase involved in cell wall biosynthesis